jgi:hypothetical protein
MKQFAADIPIDSTVDNLVRVCSYSAGRGKAVFWEGDRVVSRQETTTAERLGQGPDEWVGTGARARDKESDT